MLDHQYLLLCISLYYEKLIKNIRYDESNKTPHMINSLHINETLW